MKAIIGVAVATLLAGVLAGCSATAPEAEANDGSYGTLAELRQAVESAGVDCDKDQDVTEHGGGRSSMGCSDSYTLYMFTSPEEMRANIELTDAHRKGIIESHWVVGDDWYVITSAEEDAVDLAPKIAGEVLQVGS